MYFTDLAYFSLTSSPGILTWTSCASFPEIGTSIETSSTDPSASSCNVKSKGHFAKSPKLGWSSRFLHHLFLMSKQKLHMTDLC